MLPASCIPYPCTPHPAYHIPPTMFAAHSLYYPMAVSFHPLSYFPTSFLRVIIHPAFLPRFSESIHTLPYPYFPSFPGSLFTPLFLPSPGPFTLLFPTVFHSVPTLRYLSQSHWLSQSYLEFYSPLFHPAFPQSLFIPLSTYLPPQSVCIPLFHPVFSEPLHILHFLHVPP